LLFDFGFGYEDQGNKERKLLPPKRMCNSKGLKRGKATDFHLIGFVSTHRFTLGSKSPTTLELLICPVGNVPKSEQIFRDARSEGLDLAKASV
jgi:hypothetical protein